MATKIRLARHGRKRRPYYYIVVADSRAPRDGRFIERIGSFNPNTNPATIQLDFEKALDWITKGAQPTDTVRTILSKEGVLMKKHLLGGVKKGAFNEDEAEKRFTIWKKDAELRLIDTVNKLTEKVDSDNKTRLEAETKVKEERAAGIVAKLAEANAAAEAAKEEEKAEESTETETETPEATAE